MDEVIIVASKLPIHSQPTDSLPGDFLPYFSADSLDTKLVRSHLKPSSTRILRIA